MLMAEWKCDRCGRVATTRKERRLHAKCPMSQQERVQRALAFQDAEWIEQVREAALAGSEKARALWLQKDEANRDFALLQKMYKSEQARMAAMGMKLDGTPLEEAPAIIESETQSTTETNNEEA